MKTQSIRWISPSNIAIIKYWGKFGNQLPMNPSLSFTLSESKTDTSITWEVIPNQETCSFDFFYDGKPKPSFETKISNFLKKLEVEYNWLKLLHLEINSKNTFPHSAGIASSASAMSAIALCLVSIENEINKQPYIEDVFYKTASRISRLGSGSAARSVFPVAALWGESIPVESSANEYAIPFINNIHPIFRELQDYIFIINKNEKLVSSSGGHQLMENHPYRASRIQQANENISKLIPALATGAFPEFAMICEEEALSLHGLMMSSRPGYILLEPESLWLINEIKAFQNLTQLPITFTIDAGPNIHMLFPKSIKKEVDSWIQKSLPGYLIENRIIFDSVGLGPERII
ncbi:MAG: diphosphomevalonate decarboxylase [Saprospiraceae bacterium]